MQNNTKTHKILLWIKNTSVGIFKNSNFARPYFQHVMSPCLLAYCEIFGRHITCEVSQI